MIFDWESWKTCALGLAGTAEVVANNANAKLPMLGDVAASGATSDPCTLLDVAIAAIYPASVDSISQIMNEIVEQLVNESVAVYETGQLYHDVEVDNTLTAQQIELALGETPYNQ